MESLRESHMQQGVGRSLILFPFALQGHINPMLQLANILYSKGFSIIIIHTRFNSPNPHNYPHFTFYSIPDGLLKHEASTADVIYLVTLLNIKCVKPFSEALSKLLIDVKEEPISCIITDAAWYFTQAVANSIKLPRIVLRTSDISSFFVFAAFPLLLEKGYFKVKDSQLEEPITETPPLKVKDLPKFKTEDAKDVHSYVAQLINESKASSGLIWNSFGELEQHSLTRLCQDFPIPIFTIGPFHKSSVLGLEYNTARMDSRANFLALLCDYHQRFCIPSFCCYRSLDPVTFELVSEITIIFARVLFSDSHNMEWLSVIATIMSFTYSFIRFGLGVAKVIVIAANLRLVTLHGVLKHCSILIYDPDLVCRISMDLSFGEASKTDVTAENWRITEEENVCNKPTNP
ncbi:unnamed protein product, partial [Dovyalis caffra]